MKKYFKMAVMMVVLIMGTISFVACGDNDDEDNNTSSNPLVGTWRAEIEEKGEQQYNKNDINIIHDFGSGEYELVNSNTVRIFYSDGEVVQSRFKITDGNKFEFLDGDHGIIYYKIK